MSSDRSLESVLRGIELGMKLQSELLMNQPEQAWVPYAQPLLDAVGLFEELKLGYALIGGVAAMYYGRARFTQDIDFVVSPGYREVLSHNAMAMEKHHFAPNNVYKLFHRSGVHADLWQDEHAEQIIAHAKDTLLAGRAIRLIEPHDLIAMKLRAHRLKDDYDISEILKHTPIDEPRLAALLTPDQQEHLRQIKQRITDTSS